MRRVLVAIGLLAGCDKVFLVENAAAVDAKPPDCWNDKLTTNDDADTIVDGCDNCPLDANQGQEDTDGDGIGDVCDPHPMMPLEERVLFDPIAAIDDDKWRNVNNGNANWQTQESLPGGGIQQANVGNSNTSIALFVRTDIALVRPTFQVAIAMGQQSTSTTDFSFAGAYLVNDPATTDPTPVGFACGVAADTVTTSATRLQGPANEVDRDGNAVTFPVVIMVSADDLQCRVNGEVVAGVATAFPQQVGVALWTHNASASFTGIVVLKPRP